MLAHRPVGVELPQAGCLGPGAAERVEHLLRRQPKDGAGGRRGAERRHGAGGMPVAIVAGVHRFADPQRGFVADGHGRQEPFARRVLTLGDGQRRGDDRRGTVNRRRLVDVVELEDVRADAVRERRRSRGRPATREHRRFRGRRRSSAPARGPSAPAARAIRRAPSRASPARRGSVCSIVAASRPLNRAAASAAVKLASGCDDIDECISLPGGPPEGGALRRPRATPARHSVSRGGGRIADPESRARPAGRPGPPRLTRRHCCSDRQPHPMQPVSPSFSRSSSAIRSSTRAATAKTAAPSPPARARGCAAAFQLGGNLVE